MVFVAVHIRRPTLFVHARNDPIVDFQRVRTDDFKFRHSSEAQAHGSGKYLYQLVTVDGAHSMDWPTVSVLQLLRRI